MTCKKWAALAAALLLLLTGCGKMEESGEVPQAASEERQTETAGETGGQAVVPADDENETKIPISLQDQGSACQSELVEIRGDTVTIRGAGTFLLSGSLTDGQVVDAADTDTVCLVLQGVSVTSRNSAAVYVKQAGTAAIALENGTENVLSTSGQFTADGENNVDGVIFSKDDLSVNGQGSLKLFTEYGHGMVSKDSLEIKDGNFEINVSGHGISAKDELTISDGVFQITAGKDGLHCENNEDASMGNAVLEGGELTVSCDDDGVDVSGTLGISGGTAVINAGDDGLHSSAELRVDGGCLTVTAGDDGIHSDSDVRISGGEIEIPGSYEGIEGRTVELSGGTVHVTSSDDGLNAAGESAGGWGMTADESCSILISGGSLTVYAGGDGIDSNGSLTVTGGDTFVFGPTDSANGAVDYGCTASVTGGIFLATDSGGMAMNFTAAENQGSILARLQVQSGETLLLRNEQGETILALALPKNCGSVLISHPGILEGETYTLEAGSQSITVQMDSLISGSGMGAFGRGGPGGMEPGGMGRDGMASPPDGSFMPQEEGERGAPDQTRGW